MFEFFTKWALSSRIKKEVSRIVSTEEPSNIVSDKIKKRESKKRATREMKIQKLNALWFYCDREYAERNFFDGEYMLDNFREGILKEKSPGQAKSIMSDLFDIFEIPKDDPDRLKKVYFQSADRILNNSEDLDKKDVVSIIDKEVENYFLEEIPKNF